jgi:UDP-N-acetylglucosamine acyltransferase
VTIGRNCRIFPSAVIGCEPQDMHYNGEKTEVVIGDNVTVREFATIHRGTLKDAKVTRIGDGAMLMNYVHVAHDCQIGRNVIIANNMVMAGHVEIQDEATISGMVAVHQFCRVGAHAFVGGYSRVAQDVPPFMLGEGAVEFKLHGPNSIGLKRKGFSPDTIRALKDAYKIIYRNRRPLAQVLDETSATFPDVPEVIALVDFIRASKRGVNR